MNTFWIPTTGISLKLNFVKQSLVLIVGFYLERLVAVLGDFSLKVGNGGFVFALGGLVCLDGGLGFFHGGLGSGQLLFDYRHPLW